MSRMDNQVGHLVSTRKHSSRKNLAKKTTSVSNQKQQEVSGFDLLWEKPPGRSRGPKPSLQIDDIVKAGIHIADRDGLQGLTMRSVAEDLGVAPMALYRYVPSKDVMVDYLTEYAMQHVPRLAGRNWRENAAIWARGNFAMVKRHPWLIEVAHTRVSAGPNWARWIDAGLSALEGLPFSVSEKMAVLLLIDGHVRAGAQMLIGAKASQAWAENFARMLAKVAGDDRFPTLDSLVANGHFDAPGLGLEEMLDFGIERLLDGIEASTTTRSD